MGKIKYKFPEIGRVESPQLTRLKEICIEIGCSMMNDKCPGNPVCDILRKLKDVEK